MSCILSTIIKEVYVGVVFLILASNHRLWILMYKQLMLWIKIIHVQMSFFYYFLISLLPVYCIPVHSRK